MSESIEVRAILNVAGMRRGQIKSLPTSLAEELLDAGAVELVAGERADPQPVDTDLEPEVEETEEIAIVDDELNEEIEVEGPDVEEEIEVTEGETEADPPQGDDDGVGSDGGDAIDEIDPDTAAAFAAARAEDPGAGPSWRG